MSMDEVCARLQVLQAEMEQFNGKLRASIMELNNLNDRVNPLWQDTMRRDYDKRWIPLKESMDQYSANIGPNYVETLQQRLQEIMEYLYGNQR